MVLNSVKLTHVFRLPMPRRYSKSECLLNDMYIEKVTFSFSMNRNILGLDFF